METITTYTKKNVFKGRVIESDFLKYGKVTVKFYVGKNQIGVDVAGFSSPHIYTLSPKNQKDIEKNAFWVDKYIDPCHNAGELKIWLKITG
jgi:hypothetical protein